MMGVSPLKPGERAVFSRSAFAGIAYAPEIALTISFVVVLFAYGSAASGLA
jgi:hypothetical protein